MIAFIDMHREQFGAWAICRTLRATECGFITSRGYRASKNRKASARSVRDEILIEEVQRVHQENYSVYGCGRCGTPCGTRDGTWAATRSRG